MKPILNKEIVLDFIFNANKAEVNRKLEGAEMLSELARHNGRKEVIIELLNLAENHI